jgi:dienelactone hydrolase
LEVIFVSERPGGLGGLDLWVSTRGSTSAPLSPPVNLGPLVNSPDGEYHPTISPDGTELYFPSFRRGGEGNGDLWVCKRTKLAGAAVPIGGVPTSTGTSAVFDFTSSNASPFPSDAFTVADTAQKTGLRMNLPLPDCKAEPSTCAEIGLINELDGFSINPRIQVRFPGPIDVNTLRDGIFFVWLNDLTTEEYGLHPAGYVTPINQMLYDPATNTAYAKPDEILSQHRRYALVVTDAVRDRAAAPVSADAAFRACVSQQDGYCGQLGQVVAQVGPLFAPRNIVAASFFTTLSATAWLEKARNQLENTSPGFQLKAGFKLSELAAITHQQQTKPNPPQFQPSNVPLYLLKGVGQVAFGSYRSPRFLNKEQIIPTTPTGSAVALPAESEEIFLLAWLPESPAPAGGYPVMIFGHGAGGNPYHTVYGFASSWASRGFAVIGINAVGHGYGPEGKVTVKDWTGNETQIRFAGRAADVDGNGTFTENEGCYLWTLPGRDKVGVRDCNRQTALDLMQLVRVIRSGMDLTGDGLPDLDRSRIYYFGQSLGAHYGTVFTAVDQNVPAAVLNSGGGSLAETRVWRKQPELLATRTPSLLNLKDNYDADYVLRYRPVEVIDVPGALDIQECFERLEWCWMPGDPIAYAPHLKSSTLPGVSIKRVLFAFGKGDRTVPNPTESALVRAANMRESTSYYRHDVARTLMPNLYPDPHFFAYPIIPGKTDVMGQYLIAMLVQQQIAEFFAGEGKGVPDVNPMARLLFGKDLFEVPAVLPEDLNW